MNNTVYPKISITALFISIASVLIAITSTCLCLPSQKPTDFDYIGLLVGILSLLVALLLGWQIWLSVDLKDYDSKMNRLRNQSIIENEMIKGEIYMVIANNFLANIYQIRENNDFFYFIQYSIFSIVHYSIANDFEYCEDKVNDLLTAPLDKLSLKNYDKERLIHAASLISNKKKITNYNSLLSWILSLPVTG